MSVIVSGSLINTCTRVCRRGTAAPPTRAGTFFFSLFSLYWIVFCCHRASEEKADFNAVNAVKERKAPRRFECNGHQRRRRFHFPDASFKTRFPGRTINKKGLRLNAAAVPLALKSETGVISWSKHQPLHRLSQGSTTKPNASVLFLPSPKGAIRTCLLVLVSLRLILHIKLAALSPLQIARNGHHNFRKHMKWSQKESLGLILVSWHLEFFILTKHDSQSERADTTHMTQ